MRRSYEDTLGRGGFSLEGGPRDHSLDSLDRGVARARSAQASIGAALLVGTAFVAFAWISWRRLGSLIVDGGHLAGAGAHSYSEGDTTGGSDEAAKFKR